MKSTKFNRQPATHKFNAFKKSIQLSIILSIFISMVISFTSLNAQWQKVPIQTSEMLYDIDFHENQIILGSYKGIFHSIDQGMNWSMIPIDQGFDIPYHVLGVKFIDAINLVATGFFLDGNSQIVYRSSNNGMTWIKAYQNNFSLTPIRALYSLDFPTLKIGFAVGKNSSVIKTIDYGASWQSIYNTNELLSDVNFIDINHGIVGGTRTFAITIDGGVNWRTFGTNSDISSVCCASPTLFYVSTESYLLKTMDQGVNWDTIRNSVYDFNDILALGQDSLLVATDRGIYFSESGGKYWEVFPETKNLNFNKIKNNNATFWAIGKNGLIMNCSKLIGLKPIGGFQYIFPPPPHCEPVKVTFKNLGNPKWDYEWLLNDTLLSRDYEISQDITQNNAMQSLSLITKSAQAIDTFKKEFGFQVKGRPQLNIQDSIFSCNGISNLIDATDAKIIEKYLWKNESTGTQIGYSSKISISVDSTSIFSIIATSFDGCRDTAHFTIFIDNNFKRDLWVECSIPKDKFLLNDIQFVNENVGFAYSSNHGLLLKTIDGGDHWNSILTNIGVVNSGGIDFLNEQIGWIASYGIYKTIDGGVSWKADNQQASGANFIKFRNPMEGVAIRTGKVGSSVSELYYTSNGGVDWSTSLVSATYLNSADCSTDGVWYCVGGYLNQGFIYKSLDGGVTWEQPIHLDAGINELAVIDRDRVYFVTQNNKVYYTSDGCKSFSSQSLRPGSLHDIQMLDSLNGFILGSNSIYKTKDGGQCWNVYQYIQESDRYSRAFHMLSIDKGFISVNEFQILDKAHIYKLERGPYFDLNEPLCLPGAYKMKNLSDVNGYRDYLWFKDNVFVSNDHDPSFSDFKVGENVVKLIAINGSRRDSITRIIVGSNTPDKPQLTAPYTKFCGGSLDTLIVNNSQNLTYHWNLEPKEAVTYISINNDSIILYWNFDSQSTDLVKVSAYAINQENCTSDSLILEFPVLQNPDLYFTPDISQYYCTESRTAKKSFKIKVHPIPYDTLFWSLMSGGPEWDLKPLGDSAVLSVNLINNYYPGIISVSSRNACYENTISHEFNVVGPAEILSSPVDQSFKAGDEVNLKVVIDSWNELGITYNLYKDNQLRSSTSEEEIFVTSNFNVGDVGVYFIEVDNGCFVSRTPTFKLSMTTGIHAPSSNQAMIAFPNPFNEDLNLELQNLDININTIQIYDLLGNKLNYKANFIDDNHFCITDFKGKGFYLLKYLNVRGEMKVIQVYSY
ncbi:MAG: T9SS type A sorting domain-containing protein [Saprospiraceae bacterium]|nr:T9SS type A sorting domain-containing protein [Saprospiraceae bacterium]